MATTGPAPAATLYVRSLTTRPGRGPDPTTIERLRRLDREDTLQAWDLQVWGRVIDLSGRTAETAAGKSLCRRLAAMYDWAARNEVDLLGFERTQAGSMGSSGPARDALRLPVVALVESRDSDVVHVTPHEAQDGASRCSIGDRLAVLEAANSTNGGTDSGSPVPTACGTTY